MSLSFYMDHNVFRAITDGLTHDDDLIKHAARRQRAGPDFPGVIYIHPLQVHIGPCIEDLELIAKVYSSEEIRNQVLFLPLR